MTLTVLFDLDDTLLNTNVDVFFPEYFRALANALPGQPSIKELTRQLMFAEHKMSNNPDPGEKLSKIFSENFYYSFGTTEEACRDIIEKFYSEFHPTLQHLTKRKPGARELVTWCQSHGMKLAIATNPVFPEAATRQRIQWAGFDPEEFAFFTNYDNSHFAKPSLSYYAEILGRLGWPEAPVVMIGDDLHLDLLPTEKMGFSTFWINSNGYGNHRPKGDLFDVKNFLEKQIKNNQFYISNQPDVLIAILRSTPAVIDTWLHQYESDALTQKGSDKALSFVEVLAYMADLERAFFGPIWESLLLNPEEVINSPDPSTWSIVEDDREYNPKETYELFLSSRRKSLTLIEALLSKSSLDLPIQHNRVGGTTLHKLVELSAKRDRIHLHRCANALGI